MPRSCCGSSRSDTLFVVRQGASFVVRWPITTPEGAPIDVSTWTARAQVRTRVSSPGVLLTFTKLDNTAVTTQDGWVYLTLTAEQTSAITWRRAVFDVELEDPAGNVTKVSSGRLCVEPEVTR